MAKSRELVLFYDPEFGERANTFKTVLVCMGVRIKSVSGNDFAQTVGHLLGRAGFVQTQDTADAPAEPMLVMDGFTSKRLDILLRNIRIVTDKTAYRVILLAVLALLLALFIRRRPRRFDGRALLLLLPLLAPVLWTLALSNHASDHTYFTYRNLCGAFFALFALPALLAPNRTPSP